MLGIVIDIVYLMVGVYLIYVGFIANKVIDDNNLNNPDNNISNNKLFISQMVIGGIICLISVYKLYRIFAN